MAPQRHRSVPRRGGASPRPLETAPRQRPRRDAAGGELPLALEFALLIGERILGRAQLGLLLAIGRLHRLDLQPRRGELRLRFLDRDAVGPVVDPEQHIALGDPLIVMHLDRHDPTGDVAADHRPRRLDIGVVG